MLLAFHIALICYRPKAGLASIRAGRYDQKCISRYFSKLYRFHGI